VTATGQLDRRRLAETGSRSGDQNRLAHVDLSIVRTPIRSGDESTLRHDLTVGDLLQVRVIVHTRCPQVGPAGLDRPGDEQDAATTMSWPSLPRRTGRQVLVPANAGSQRGLS
jgi:hypothetical protein